MKASTVREHEQQPPKRDRSAAARSEERANAASDSPRSPLAPSQGPLLAAQQTGLLLGLQQSHGNRYVQRLLASSAPSAPPAADGPAGTEHSGQPLEGSLRHDMEHRFGTGFPSVRVHTDSAAADVAKRLGAHAFTAGQDIYFSEGAYRPETAAGRGLLAHELSHTVQQRAQVPNPQSALEVAPADDPLERQAALAAEEVVGPGDGPGPAVRALAPSASAPTGALVVHRQAAATPTSPEAAAKGAPTAAPGGPPAPPAGPTPEGDFVIALGGGLKIPHAEIAAALPKRRLDKDVSSFSLPGMKVERLVLELEREPARVKGGRINADIDVPYVKTAGGAQFRVDEAGQASFALKGTLDVPALNNPKIDLSLEDRAVAAEVTLAAEQIKPRGIPKLNIPRASVVIGIARGKLYGSGQVALEYPGLATGEFSVEVTNGEPSGKGTVELTPEYLKGVRGELQVSKGHLEGALTLPASKLKPPIPGLAITAGTLTLGMKNGVLSGAGEGIAFAYQSLGAGTLGFTITKDHLEGTGALELTIPGIAPVKGNLRYQGGRLSGQATITPDKFPKGLPIRSGSITVAVDDQAAISGRGSVVIGLLGIGQGELKLGYEKGILDIGADVELTRLPGLETGRVRIGLKDGVLEGEGQIAVAPKQIPGLSGNLLVVYKDDRFSGTARLGYAKEKFAGEVELFLAQDDKGAMAVSGSGEVTARLTDWLTGKVHIDVLPDATTKIAGQLKADDIELFPEKKGDKELFSISQNIPLWAILVAVIRLRGGVRAGVGPGKLRGVTAEGQFSTGEGEQPSFSITGELFIPAYAEAYIAFGAGLGLDVVIGSLTGGIEAVGTAGVYGAVSVIPEIAYEAGDFSISGTATLAAAAKLKLGLQAWAEVEAFWITVWSNEWKLAEWVWDVGPELALQADMKYVFGRPEPPTFDFKTSDIDAKKLIQDAMPKEGPKGSGAREALQNRAEWKGALKEQRKEASKIPADLADQQAKAPQPKDAPSKPPKKTPPAGLTPAEPTKTKEELAKDLETKAAPGASKETDPTHKDRWDKGTKALADLAARAKSDPEDSEEIAKHLADIKSTYGFKTLEHRREGEQWLIDAAMSPGTKYYIDADDVEPDELMGGKTYSQLRGTEGITPDHEPQNAVMKYISSKNFTVTRNGKDTGIRPFPAGTKVSDYSHGTGICLNMNRYRHEEFSRTWGPRGAETKAEAVKEIEDEWNSMPEYADVERTRKEARKRVAKVVRGELTADHRKVRQIYEKAAKKKKVKERLDAGLEAVREANKEKYREAFED